MWGVAKSTVLLRSRGEFGRKSVIGPQILPRKSACRTLGTEWRHGVVLLDLECRHGVVPLSAGERFRGREKSPAPGPATRGAMP